MGVGSYQYPVVEYSPQQPHSQAEPFSPSRRQYQRQCCAAEHVNAISRCVRHRTGLELDKASKPSCQPPLQQFKGDTEFQYAAGAG